MTYEKVAWCLRTVDEEAPLEGHFCVVWNERRPPERFPQDSGGQARGNLPAVWSRFVNVSCRHRQWHTHVSTQGKGACSGCTVEILRTLEPLENRHLRQCAFLNRLLFFPTCAFSDASACKLSRATYTF